jgi:hypothetical protein
MYLLWLQVSVEEVQTPSGGRWITFRPQGAPGVATLPSLLFLQGVAVPLESFAVRQHFTLALFAHASN